MGWIDVLELGLIGYQAIRLLAFGLVIILGGIGVIVWLLLRRAPPISRTPPHDGTNGRPDSPAELDSRRPVRGWWQRTFG
jgi:hypothetical protein